MATTKQAMSVRGAAFLGVGAMVGAGIFALLGEAGAVAGSAVWVSFLLGGVVAGLLGYVVAQLGATYPSGGGLITYLVKGYGPGHVSAVVSWLLYFAALIVTSMVALSFGNYGAALVTGGEGSTTWARIFTSVLIVAVAALNIRGTSAIDRIQSTIVIVLLAVFAVFIVATFTQVDVSLLSRDTYPPAGSIISSIALTFFAYLGFAVVSYTAGDLPDPRRSLPRAMFLALGITTVLYVLISIGVFGTLTVEEVIANGDTALAEAARPVLGNAGYAMMAVAALLATASSVNANIYGAVGSTKELATTGLFPPIFGRPRHLRQHPRAGHLVRRRPRARQPRRPLLDRLAGQHRGARHLPHGRRRRAATARGGRDQPRRRARRDRLDARGARRLRASRPWWRIRASSSPCSRCWPWPS